MTTYSTSPQSYLERAKKWLLKEGPEYLPHAALELRCCIESRQAEYMGAHEFFNKKIRPWEMGNNSKQLRKYWQDNRIAELTYVFPSESYVTYFTPVTKDLVESSEKQLGMLLHALSNDIVNKLGWYEAAHAGLIEIYRKAWVACRGEHIAMPLRNNKTGQMIPSHMQGGEEIKPLIDRLMACYENHENIQIAVAYHESPPSTWVSDL